MAEAIRTAEDRELFKQAMQGIGLQVPPSGVAHSMDDAHEVIQRIGLPVVIRPAYILGGKGTGIATTASSSTISPVTFTPTVPRPWAGADR